MKKILAIAFLALSISVKAQITLENTYDSAGTVNPYNSQQMIVKFEVSGEKYVKINRAAKIISLYDMNHSLLKTISLVSFPMNGNGTMGDVLYLSEKLFDTDNLMEFMYTTQTLNTTFYTQIINENGIVLFGDTGAPRILAGAPLQQYPIYNTTVGTKMILSYPNSQAKIFGLPGTLSTGIQEGNAQLMQAQGGSLSNLYPNPSTGKVTLQYELPKGEKEGEIILYNTQGAEVKRYKVDDTFNDLLLDNTILPAGVYYYQLQISKGAVGSKKMVVVK